VQSYPTIYKGCIKNITQLQRVYTQQVYAILFNRWQHHWLGAILLPSVPSVTLWDVPSPLGVSMLVPEFQKVIPFVRNKGNDDPLGHKGDFLPPFCMYFSKQATPLDILPPYVRTIFKKVTPIVGRTLYTFEAEIYPFSEQGGFCNRFSKQCSVTCYRNRASEYTNGSRIAPNSISSVNQNILNLLRINPLKPDIMFSDIPCVHA
jgi:hypothetical protein